jgi:hypothetical protein
LRRNLLTSSARSGAGSISPAAPAAADARKPRRESVAIRVMDMALQSPRWSTAFRGAGICGRRRLRRSPVEDGVRAVRPVLRGGQGRKVEGRSTAGLPAPCSRSGWRGKKKCRRFRRQDRSSRHDDRLDRSRPCAWFRRPCSSSSCSRCLPRGSQTPRRRQRAGGRPGSARTQTCPMIKRRRGPCRQKPDTMP